MGKVKHIVVTGFSGTGSSAAIDLLKEFEGSGVTFNKKEYEDYFLSVPGGLFDLEWKLLYNNDPHRSDEAITGFYNVMKRFYERDFDWFAGYKRNIGKEFIDMIEDFISEISVRSDRTWYYRYQKRRFSLFRYIYRFFRYKIADPSFQLNGIHVETEREPIYISYPGKEEFFCSARKLLARYMDLISSYPVNIHDHLIWPSHVQNIGTYFDDSYRFIIVHRDARDVFLTNCFQKGTFGIYPTVAEEFVGYWDRLLSMGKNQSNKHAMHIWFEDLIYHYETESRKIAEFCGLSLNQWKRKREFFIPEKSIKNTQLFRINADCKEKGDRIKKEIPQYLYDFPYEIQTSIKEMFV